jgi:hypothetical protein
MLKFRRYQNKPNKEIRESSARSVSATPSGNPHYVLQFLLKNFARSGKLFELDGQSQCFKKQNAKGAAVSYRFYEDEDFEKIAGQERFWQLHFGKWENVWARSLRRILKGVRGEANCRLSLEDRAILSGMMGWESILTPATRKTMEKTARASMEQWGGAPQRSGQRPNHDWTIALPKGTRGFAGFFTNRAGGMPVGV